MKEVYMPYIPPKNRPMIDEKVIALAQEISSALVKNSATAEISELYRICFEAIASFIRRYESSGNKCIPMNASEELALSVIKAAESYNQKSAWVGELNYALTMLIQQVPYQMVKRGIWSEYLRYWLYAQTVGALVCTSYRIQSSGNNDWITNGLAGVFEDVKDEYKRRVNTAYEAAQIRKSGDCYHFVPFHTQLVATVMEGVKGYIEVQLDQHEPEGKQ
jgi:hypothetical protein